MHFRGILYGFFFLFVNKNIKILVIIVIPTHILFVSPVDFGNIFFGHNRKRDRFLAHIPP